MGNCQAIDNAALVIQHPCGRADKLYWPVTASEVMKTNPGHCVALLLTTTTFSPSSATAATSAATKTAVTANRNSYNSVRITRIKLLRPTDTLVLGQVYRLVTTQEVMKGLCAKKYAKMKKKHPELNDKNQEWLKQKLGSDIGAAPTKSQTENEQQVQKQGKHRLRAEKSTNDSGAAAKSRAWQPSLKSISEAAS